MRDSMSSSCTMVDRPSEHSSRRSPVSTLISYRSGCRCGSLPSARVMTERWGCVRASSGVSWPASIMSAIRLWSRVSCCSLPWWSRYARESPTWAMTRRSPSSIAAVHVVPMPSRPTPSCTPRSTARFAATTALPSAFASGWAGACSASTFTAISDATSPAACPPMPSATANSGGETTRLSSLWSRRHPTSVRLPKVLAGVRVLVARLCGRELAIRQTSREWPRRPRSRRRCS